MIIVAVLECKSGAIAAKNGLFAKRSKLKNFAPKILLCAERGVLSVRNANIVHAERIKPPTPSSCRE